jgi:hypothetical protein
MSPESMKIRKKLATSNPANAPKNIGLYFDFFIGFVFYI